MRLSLLCLALTVFSPFALAQTKFSYSNLDNLTNLEASTADGTSTTGWGWCSDCAGGGSDASSYQVSWGQQPSVDGTGSAEFFISGPQYANALFWYKVGANDNVTHYQYDFWVQVDSQAASYAQALEFDTYHLTGGREYMFGTQCDYTKGYGHGRWDVWNQEELKWQATSTSCPGFVAGEWYHITWTFHRRSDTRMSFDTVKVEHYSSDLKKRYSSTSHSFNVSYPSSVMPAGWSHNLGVQVQIDLNGLGGQVPMWVDKINLAAW